MNIVSGARVSRGGLHLGHYLGCFQKLVNSELKNESYFFVLNDIPPSIERQQCMKEMLLDLYAIKATYHISNFYVILDSEILSEYTSFLKFLKRQVTLPQLLSVYPRNANGTYVGSTINDFLFPIEQAAMYYLFNADYAYLNDDNLRFVTFARELAKKINNLDCGLKLPETILITGKVPHICGYNYKKMSKANGNGIFLSESLDNIKHKLYKLFDLRSLFRMYPEEEKKFESSYPYQLPVHFAPFQFFKAFSDNESFLSGDHMKDSTKRIFFLKQLTDIIMEIIIPIQKNREHINENDLFTYLDRDISVAHKLIAPEFKTSIL